MNNNYRPPMPYTDREGHVLRRAFTDFDDDDQFEEGDGIDYDFLPPDRWQESLSTFIARLISKLRHLLKKE